MIFTILMTIPFSPMRKWRLTKPNQNPTEAQLGSLFCFLICEKQANETHRIVVYIKSEIQLKGIANCCMAL
jgi:hypothetical protein